MLIVKIKADLIHRFNQDPQMLQKENRPCVLILKLKYKGNNYHFAVPIRSNISAASPKNEYFALPTRYATKDKNRHGLHYIKMFPVTKSDYDKYRTENNLAAALVKATVDQNEKQIIAECQEYLSRYEAGNKPLYATDLDLLISILYPPL